MNAPHISSPAGWAKILRKSKAREKTAASSSGKQLRSRSQRASETQYTVRTTQAAQQCKKEVSQNIK
jgi:hypothetical protein